MAREGGGKKKEGLIRISPSLKCAEKTKCGKKKKKGDQKIKNKRTLFLAG